jgi:hypothetical protein
MFTFLEVRQMQSSELECIVHDILEEYDVVYEEEYEFPDLVASSGRALRFDFACFDDAGDLDYLIEVQGRQHYHAVGKFGGAKALRRQKYNDLQKRKYCQQNNITLVTIPYEDFETCKVNYEYIMMKAGY